jgi:DNA-binding response OmpR family regulator
MSLVHLLIVEDEQKLAGLLRRGLREEGHLVDVAARGDDALLMASVNGYDRIVVDLMLPGIGGLELCRRLRERGVETPILILTGRDTAEYRIAGLDAGADDYLRKPFGYDEFAARVYTLARRRPVA